MLACNLQAFSRVQLSWSRMRTSELDNEPIETNAVGIAQVGNLLLINRAQRNHSGRYLCQARNALGEERLEIDLLVRGKCISSSSHSHPLSQTERAR